MGYARSPFRDFGSYLRIVVGLNEKNIEEILKQFNSHFITYERPPGLHTIKDISEVVYTKRDHEKNLQIENDDDSMKTKLILTRFGLTFRTVRCDEKTFSNTLLGFTQYLDSKRTNVFHADSPGVYISSKILIF